jgi:hypothetical protein
MENVELRPMSLGELLDHTFSLYRNHFWVFVGIMAIPSCFAIPMNFFLFSKQGSPLAIGTPRAQAAVFSLSYLIFATIFALVYAIASGAATHAVADAYLGRAPSVRGSYERVRGRFWRLIGLVSNVGLRMLAIFLGVVLVAAFGGGLAGAAMAGAGRTADQTTMVLIVGLIVVVAVLAGAALAIFIGLRYAVAIPALLFENIGALAAIRRSVRLTKGRRGHIFLAVLMTSIIGYVGVVIFRGPFWLAAALTARTGHWTDWLNFAAAASAAVGASLTGPLLMIILVLCYYDARIRKEAFDLQFMMASMDNPPSAPAPGATSPA